MMRFGSVCSGIEAASVAWAPIGWKAAWLSEIEPFPSAVLAHHYPDVPNLGDMTKLAAMIRAGEIEAPDVFCGGTPCQAFSVAGLRKSLDDARGNLSLTFCEIANELDTARLAAGKQPTIVFWENVPGVLNTKDNAFGCFLAGLAGEADPLEPPGGKWSNAGAVLGHQRAVAWRVLDAQYFGVAQRRRRVFVVASARNGFDPAAVLFEFDGVRRDSAPSRKQGQDAAGCLASRTDGGGFPGTDEACSGYVQPVVGTLTASFGRLPGQSGQDADHGHSHLVPDIAHTLRGEGFDASEDGTGRGTPLVPVAFQPGNLKRGCGSEPNTEVFPTLAASHGRGQSDQDPHVMVPVAYAPEVAGTLVARSSRGGGQTNSPGHQADQQIVAFDTTQITSAANYSNPKPGDPCHPLAAGAHALAIAFHPTQEPISSTDGTTHCMGTGGSGGTATIAVAFSSKDYGGDATADLSPTLRAMGHADSHANGGGQMAVAVALRDREGGATAELGDEVQNCLRASSGGGDKPHVLAAMQVRRLTPVECERLQGFPDGYTAIPWRKKPASECPDGPRYKALGNSWAVPNVRWIGARIHAHVLALEHANDNSLAASEVAA